ncbi:MAG: ABC transporter permease subunit [Candidatus Aegiribacteria sp.]|nr:ABC transporter permease subunit [Candidatus Aegiribacteria sp.]MBD3295653.1 ABC transporter permease subunit [Candidatus Fermentibacteria bacterium]
MNKPSMTFSRILSIVRKDLREFIRDRLWMVLTPLSLVVVVGIFLVLPDELSQDLTLGVYPEEAASALKLIVETQRENLNSIEIVAFGNREDLAAAVLSPASSDSVRSVPLGIAFPGNMLDMQLDEGTEQVDLYLSASVPPAIGRAVESGIREAGFALQALLTGRNPLGNLPVSLPNIESRIVGVNRFGQNYTLRDRLRPMLVVMILFIEALALAGLVSVEIQHRTVSAVLVTPASMGDFLVAKCLTGIILAMFQAFVFLFATGPFSVNLIPVSLLILSGAMMASAVGMLSGAGGRDFLGTMFFGILLLVPMMIPAIASLFPGRSPLIIRLLPSYGLIEGAGGTIGEGLGWEFAAPHLLSTAAWAAGLLVLSFAILKRRAESL